MHIKATKRITNMKISAACDGKRKVASAEDVSEEYEDEIKEIGQEFTSENTSINSSKLPAIFKMVSFEPGTVNIDYGGGRFDNVADYLTQFDVINLVYDPYNRTPEHNKEVIRTVRQHGGADTATCSNVLNVIKEPEVRKNVLENIKKLVKPTGIVYITVYEGTGKGDEGATKSGYQLNRKTADYLEEIQEVFPDAKRKGKLIFAHPSGAVESSTYIEASDSVSKADLARELNDATKEAMVNRFGFPEDEAEDYFVVDIHPADDEDYTAVEVRAELSYDSMDELMYEVLDPIIEGYDYEAYFDLESPGIAVAWIPNTVAISSASGIPEPSLYPPESNDPEYLDGQESVDIDIDADIEVDDNGVVEFVTDIDDALEGIFAESVNTTIRDYDSVLEDIDSLLADVDVPEAGKYHIKGTAHLIYDIEGAEFIEGNDSFADEIDTSRMEVSLNKKSNIENLSIK